MTKGQLVSILLGIAVIALAFAIPPYYDDGGIIGGTVYYPFRKPPDETYISFNGWLFDWELAYLILTLVTAWIAFRATSTQRQRKVFWTAMFLETVWFGGNLRGFNTILAPEFTFYLLTLVAVVLFVVIFLMSPGPETEIRL